METAIVENGYIKVTKNGRFFRTYNGKECNLNTIRIKNKAYYYIVYSLNGKQVNRYAHRLYAEAFIKKSESSGDIVMAKDGNLMNLSDDNLYWSDNSKRLTEHYRTNKDNRNSCSVCGTKVYGLKKGDMCSYCKKDERARLQTIERKQKRLDKLKKEFQHVDMDVISTREADMINMRINDCTLEEIGEKYDLSRERVRQILNKVKKKF